MKDQLKKHLTIIAAAHIAFGALGLVVALAFSLALVGGGLISGNQDALAITTVVATVFGGFTAALSLPMLLAGAGLLRFKPWARVLTLILAVLNLLNIPVGTILGAYTIWALMSDEAEALFIN